MESTQKQIVIGLVAIAVLLAAIVGVLIYQQNNTIPEPTVGAGDAGTGTATDAGASGMPPAATPAAEFDPATAPKVPEGQTPEEYVKAYYQACQDKKFGEAYAMLPTATQAYYGDAAGFQSTLEGYGITGFSVQPQAETEDGISVVGSQQAQGMEFPYTWAFVQGDDGSWLVASRTMGAAQ